MNRATLLEFARVSDAAADTTKKLRKQAILAEYFQRLSDEDLRLAVRFATGCTTGLRGVRVLNVGWAQVSRVLIELLELGPAHYHDLVVRSGEIGEALSQLWADRATSSSQTEPLLLSDVAAAFDDLADTSSPQRKRAVLHRLYRRCGEPREAAYLSKLIFREMRTGIQEGLLLQAIAQAFDASFDQVRRAQLLVGDLGEVAVLARDRNLEHASFCLFHPIQFMLAAARESAAGAAGAMAGRTFFAENKFDGIRAQAHKKGSELAIYTRTMDRCDESFPDVVQAISGIPGDFLLDGEIVPYQDGKVLPFAHIQRRLGRKVLSDRTVRENPLRFVAFDLLYRNGDLLMDRPLRQRRQALEELLESQAAPDADHGVLLSRAIELSRIDEIEAAFATAREAGNEGLVLKDPDSPYLSGRRGRAWLKLKTHLPTIDCVVTAAETGHGKRRNSLSDYTFAVWDRDPSKPAANLMNVGKAYSGVSDEEIAQLTTLFTQLTREQIGRVRIVEPRIVLEIACDQIQISNRHASGYAFRFPRIKRIRWDKRPEDADQLCRVRELYESPSNFGRSRHPIPEPAELPTLFDELPG